MGKNLNNSTVLSPYSLYLSYLLIADCYAVTSLARLNSTANIAVATGNVRHHTARDTIVAVMIPNPPKMTPTIPAATFIIKSRCN